MAGSTAELFRSEGKDLFRRLFEESADAVLLMERSQIVDGNRAALKMLRLDALGQLRKKHPAELSPEFQPGGRPSIQKAEEMIITALQNGSHRYEWMHRRADGEDFPVEVLLTVIEQSGQKTIHAVLREIGDRLRLEQQIRDSLRQRTQEVQISTEIAQQIAGAPALEELYHRVVTLIKERFGYHHVQIFEHDPERNAMVVVEAYGQVGEKIKAAGRRLPYGYGVVGEVASTGQAVLISDTSTNPDWIPHPDLLETRGELAVPIKLRDKVLGVLDVQSKVAGALTEENQTVLMGLAGQIASAIENARLLAQTERALSRAEVQATRAAALYELSQQLSQAESLDDIFRVAATQTLQVVKADRVSIALLNPAGDSLKVLALQGGADTLPVGMQLPVQGTAIGKAAITNQTMIIPIHPDSEWEDTRALAEQGLLSTLVAPLSVGGQVRGTLNLGSFQPNAYSTNDARLLLQVASLLAPMMEGRRLFAQVERRALWLQTAAKVSRAASTILDPDELIQGVVELIHTRFGLYYAGLFLVDHSEDKWVVLRVGTGSAGEEMVAQGHKLEIGGESMIGSCMSEREPRIAMDVGDEAIRFDNPLLPKTRTELALPLVSRGQAIGALSIQSDQESAFSSEDITVLRSMADQVATSIDNASMIESTQGRAERERLVRSIADRVRSGVDAEAIMRVTVQELSNLLGASKSVIRLGSREHLQANLPAGPEQSSEHDNGSGSD